jgi:hypothetical protein
MDSESRLCARTQPEKNDREKRGEFISSFTVKFISLTLMVHDIVEHNLHRPRKLLQSVEINNKLGNDIEKFACIDSVFFRFAGS